MAKRLTDTEKWKDDWYIQLSNDDKIVWQWLLDNCSHAGICKRSLGLLNLMCNVKYTEEKMMELMEGRVLITGNSWFIPKFIKFQYSTLHSAKPVIVSAVKELFSMNCIKLIPKAFGDDYIIIAKSLDNYLTMIKAKAITKDTSKDKVKDNTVETSHLNGFAIYDAEAEILKNQKRFEEICMTTGKVQKEAKDSLRKYHLHLAEKEQYPRGKAAIFAGFEKWLINEKTFNTNGSTGQFQKSRVVGRDPVDDKL